MIPTMALEAMRTPEAIARLSRVEKIKLLKAIKEESRRRLLAFTLYTKRDYRPSWFHHLVANELDWFLTEVMARRSPRLMLFAPPRHGKTELVSRRFPAFALGRCPDLSIIATSYSNDLAGSINRDVQRVIDTEEYHDLFPETLLSKSSVCRQS